MAKAKEFTCTACRYVGTAVKNKVWKANCCANCGSMKIEEGTRNERNTRIGVCECGSSSFKLHYLDRVLYRTCNACKDTIDPTKIELTGGKENE